MSGFVSKADDPSYEDRAGALLAQVADLLLTATPDWKTLERLEAALAPPRKPAYEYFKKTVPSTSDRTTPLKEYGTYTLGGGIASSSDVVKAMEAVYSEKMLRMLKEEIAVDKTAVFKSLYSGEPKGPDLPNHSHSVNPASYDYIYKAMAPDPITTETLKKYIKEMRYDDEGDSMR